MIQLLISDKETKNNNLEAVDYLDKWADQVPKSYSLDKRMIRCRSIDSRTDTSTAPCPRSRCRQIQILIDDQPRPYPWNIQWSDNAASPSTIGLDRTRKLQPFPSSRAHNSVTWCEASCVGFPLKQVTIRTGEENHLTGVIALNLGRKWILDRRHSRTLNGCKWTFH